jgi:hypothetical protein
LARVCRATPASAATWQIGRPPSTRWHRRRRPSGVSGALRWATRVLLVQCVCLVASHLTKGTLSHARNQQPRRVTNVPGCNSAHGRMHRIPGDTARHLAPSVRRCADCGIAALRILGPAAARGTESTVVVDEGEEDGLTAADDRPVQGVAGPPHVRRLGLEPAERPRWLGRRPGGSARTGTTRSPGPVRPAPVLPCHGRRPWHLLQLAHFRTRVARVLDKQPPSKGQLVLIGFQDRADDNISPPVTPAAACHADTAPTNPSRRRAADPNAPTT